MLRSLIHFSLRFPWVVLGFATMLAVGGLLRLNQADWDVFPEFAPPQITVQTEAPGLTAEEVEQLVTVPIETALSGVSRLTILRSSSVPGLSVVTGIFEEGTEVLVARQLFNERLAEAQSMLPDVAKQPRMMPLTSSTSRLLMIGLTTKAEPTADNPHPYQQLRSLADWSIRRRLQAVKGVAHVEVFGGEVKQHEILVSPERLQANRVTLDEVVTTARQATGFGGAGFLETENQRLSIRQRTRIEGSSDIADSTIAVRDGAVIKLGDVTVVRDGAVDSYGGATINGVSGVMLIVHKQPDVNTLTVTNAVQDALAEIKAALPDYVTLHPTLFRQAAFIERAISNLGHSLLIGCVLVTIVLTLFLMNVRVLVISLTTIPLSLLGAVLVLLQSGATLNAMTLGGLAIALGELVDDAIVDVENVLRRLRENRQLKNPKPFAQIVFDASMEVRSAVIFGTFVVILVFVPVFFLDGLAGKIFGPLGMAYITAILTSLLIALTVTPAMCVLLLREKEDLLKSKAIDDQLRSKMRETDPILVGLLNSVYCWLLPSFLRHPWWISGGAFIMLAVTLGSLPYLGGEFLPDFRESNFVIFMAGKPDSSLAESERAGKLLAKELLEIRGVHSVAQQIGRANLSEDTWGTNISEVWVRLSDDADYDEVFSEIRELTERTPGYVFQTKQFLRERIDEVLTGSTADLLVRLVGPDLNVLRQLADESKKAIHDVQGVEDLRVEQLVEIPQLDVLLKPERTSQYGLSVGQVNAAIQTLIRGTKVGQVYEEDRVFDLVVRGIPELRSNPLAIKDVLIDSPFGHPVPLGELAQIDILAAPNMINREQGRRRLLVTCNAEGRDVVSVMNEIQQRLRDRVELPAGYHFEFAGEYAAKAESQTRLVSLSGLSLLGILLLLYVDFKSLTLSLLVMMCVPFSCVGGIASLLLSGGDLSLGSLVGFVTVFGIAVRNGILLINNFERRRSEGHSHSLELVVEGSVERLAPILMTAATTVLAIVPLVISGNLPGHEIEHPMAIVIVGGLVSSTLLSLVVLPSLYLVLRNGSGRSIESNRADRMASPAPAPKAIGEP